MVDLTTPGRISPPHNIIRMIPYELNLKQSSFNVFYKPVDILQYRFV